MTQGSDRKERLGSLGSIIGLQIGEEKQQLVSLVSEHLSEENTGIQVYIGDESPIQTMRDCSVVTVAYELGEGVTGTIGIIGPKRMDYEKVLNNLKNLKKQLDVIYHKEEK